MGPVVRVVEIPPFVMFGPATLRADGIWWQLISWDTGTRILATEFPLGVVDAAGKIQLAQV